jgi:ABC-2 type transport system permease protein
VRGAWTIYRRELAGLFLGPLAWVLLCLALFVHGQFFSVFLRAAGGEVTDALALSLGLGVVFWVLMTLLPPLLTMRMVSEEAKSGMLEFVLTAPVSDAGVVLGKLAAAVTFMGLVWASTFLFGALCAWQGVAPDWSALAVACLGAILISALFCSIGLAASALTQTPVLAAFLALVANVVLLSLPYLAGQLGLGSNHWLRRAAGELDVVSRHGASFMRGAIDTRHLAFYLVWTAFFAFLATRLLEARRWKT